MNIEVLSEHFMQFTIRAQLKDMPSFHKAIMDKDIFRLNMEGSKQMEFNRQLEDKLHSGISCKNSLSNCY